MTEESILSGTFSRCLVHYGESAWDQDHLRFLADWSCIESKAVERWLSGQSAPAGESHVRAMYALSFAGYEIEELSRVDRVVRGLAELIVFKVLSVDELCIKLEYTGIETGRTQLFNVLLRGAGMRSSRMIKSRELAEMYRERIEDVRTNFLAARPRFQAAGGHISTYQSPTRDDVASSGKTRSAIVSRAVKVEPTTAVNQGISDMETTLAAAHGRALLPYIDHLLRTRNGRRELFFKLMGGKIQAQKLSDGLLVLLSNIDE